MSKLNKGTTLCQAYLKEFRKLKQKGVRLFYPYDTERTPRQIAEAMAYDRCATYMRDFVIDREGRLKIHFIRIEL